MALPSGGYWAASDLATLAPKPGGVALLASSLPLGIDVFQAFIALSSNEFDAAAAGAGKLTPIPTTATQAYLFAQNVVMDGALYRALEKMPGVDPKLIDRYKVAYDTVLKAIGDGTLGVPGAPDDPSQGGRLLVRSGGIPSAIFTASMGYTDGGGGPVDF